jgi:ParB/RepB/Spo0J family partition protein
MTTTTGETRFETDQPISTISKHSNNPRRRAIADPDMVASIAEHGVLQPLIVAPDLKAPGKYVLIAGHRRLNGAKKAKRKTVPVVIRADLATDAQQLEQMLIENVHRQDLTPIEEAEGYHQLELFGYKPQTIATAVGRDVKTVRGRLRLLKLAATTKKKVDAGQLSLEDALAIGEFADDPEVTKRLEASVRDGWNFKQELQRARRDRTARREHAAAVAKLLDAGAAQLELPADTYWWSWSSTQGYRDLSSTHSTDWGQHKGCLAFCQYDSYGPNLAIVCTNVAKHQKAIDASRTEEQRERAAKSAEIEAEAQAAAAASDVRTQSLTAHVAGTPLPTAWVELMRVALPTLVHELNTDGAIRSYQDLLEIPADDRWDHTFHYENSRRSRTLFAQHCEEFADAGAATISRHVAAVAAILLEENLLSRWNRDTAAARRELEFLEAIGHPFGDVDLQLKAALDAASAPATEKAS